MPESALAAHTPVTNALRRDNCVEQHEKAKIKNKPEKVIYTAKTHTTGGRDGASRRTDGRLDVKLSTPGAAGVGTNPQQLFAAGWSACWSCPPSRRPVIAEPR